MAEASASAVRSSASSPALPFDPDAKPAKSILKGERRSSKPLKWDEMNILMTEHPPDKDYGHMKINEPPTPYNREYEEEEEAPAAGNAPGDAAEEPIDGAALKKLLEARSKSDNASWEAREEHASSEDDADLTPEAKAEKDKFRSKRKAHYNEFEMVKRMRDKRKAAKKAGGDEDDEEEEEEE